MKKTFLLVCLFAFTTSTFAQKIELDKIENGERTIICSHENVRSFKDKVVFSVALISNTNKSGENFYNLSLKATSLSPITVPKGGKLLIKTADGSVIELSTQMEYAGTVRDVHNVNGYVYSDYSIFPSFSLTPAQIDKICKGVTKIRLETSLDAVDKEFKKDKIGKVIDAEYKLIQKALSNPKSFNDGF